MSAAQQWNILSSCWRPDLRCPMRYASSSKQRLAGYTDEPALHRLLSAAVRSADLAAFLAAVEGE